MANGLKYFIFNKEQDYRRGYLEHMECSEEGIWVQENSHEKATFLSRILDSREMQMNWHRLTLKESVQDSAPYKITVYAADVRQFIWKDQTLTLDDLTERIRLPMSERVKMMEPFVQKRIHGASDMLLHEVTGRYLWIMVEMYRQGNERNSLNDITIYFPRQTWLSYLPEIYQKEDREQMFLERYLGIFQTMYEDLNWEISHSARYFDMESTSQEFLVWLAKWLDIGESYLWSEDQLRVLLAQAVSLYKRRGTRQGLIDFITLFTGECPYVVEYFQLQEFSKDKDYYDQLLRLYGGDVNTFSVITRDVAVPDTEKYKTLKKMIDEIKPAHMELNLIIIKPYLFLSGHSYLGINSVLGQYGAVALDGRSMLPFLSVGGTAI